MQRNRMKTIHDHEELQKLIAMAEVLQKSVLALWRAIKKASMIINFD
jgi:hypothetical protein